MTFLGFRVEGLGFRVEGSSPNRRGDLAVGGSPRAAAKPGPLAATWALQRSASGLGLRVQGLGSRVRV